MKGIKTVEQGKAEIKDIPVPKIKDGFILAKVKAVALNPTDWKHIHFDRLFVPDHTSGCDFAGTVEQIGPNVTKAWKAGDRIAGFAHGVNTGHPEDGAFAEYCLVKADNAVRVPDNLSDEQAATLPIGLVTVGLCLYHSLKFPLPGTATGPRAPLVVYGASTATGTLGVQFAAQSGFDVVAVCSAKNFDLVRKLGASATFDYRDADCGAQIRAHTQNQLRYGFDCIATEGSARILCDAISTEGGTIATIGLAEYERKDIERRFSLGYTHIGEKFVKGGNEWEAQPADSAFTSKFIPECEKLLAEGKIVPHPHELKDGGLEGVLQGLELLRTDQVSGVKLVYRIADTPSIHAAGQA